MSKHLDGKVARLHLNKLASNLKNYQMIKPVTLELILRVLLNQIITDINLKKYKICIIGWLCWFTIGIWIFKKFKTIGFDINNQRIKELKKVLIANEVSKKYTFVIKDNCSNNLIGFIQHQMKVKSWWWYIHCNCTNSINKNKHPDLNPLIKVNYR